MREPFILETRQEIARPLADVFAFFAAPENLEAITPPWLNFRILTPGPIRMERGALIEYKIRLRGIPIRWRTEITGYDPPRMFIDKQIRGPYILWEHTHTFEPSRTDDGRDSTRIVDRIRYVPRDIPHWVPLLGGLLHRVIVRPDLERIFAYRKTQIARMLDP
ncbi:MAG: SRPBCC family protein [Phycisphaerales bacterium]|nr:SRPBCC family protein [Phycisphaerales bacterium]